MKKGVTRRMYRLFNFSRIIERIKRRKILYLQLERYYPKNTYDRLARKEMKVVLAQFNDAFYDAYPEMVENPLHIVSEYYPKRHSRQYEVQRAIKICKAHKVRHKHIKQIEEYLNLQYVIEEQLFYYNKEIRKVRQAQTLLDQGTFSSFFVELYEERMSTLIKIGDHGF